ncbi:BZ3500_MvSof-1268-A1-R1_Chr5-1g07646 [Microbotryum saponariae]|uniref:BZ3500_MvSof-1268-A1-R1_Chr5-1g07646 protein n=1 Tax=Microbotryum saponariae TaxID=289078 RepID=A0A2X0NJF1_9BASI|nr:BZ3500_MvSof-1268-A1-R1_Chr5-1g07646 [Microbotryum saponariae]SDA05517.1 BZ3501_MvSof-1269-A2-R1_Chr5-2g07470 [Microbotryum saponariae]
MPPLAAALPRGNPAGAPHSANEAVPPHTSTPTSAAPTTTEDATSRWEAHIRSEWLAPPAPFPSSFSSCSSVGSIRGSSDSLARTGGRRGRPLDPVFRERLRQLERMLRFQGTGIEDGGSDGPTLPTGSSTSHAPAATAAVAEETESPNRSVEVGETPDGGDVIGVVTGRRNELKKANEGILLAFKQGRVLREPLPLSLVTALLYRSWEMDGTIPVDYVPPISANPPPNGSSQVRARQDHIKHTDTETGTRVETPLPEVCSGAGGPSEWPGVHGDAGQDGAPPGDLRPKMKMDRLKGARWRTEKEVASGSDVI